MRIYRLIVLFLLVICSELKAADLKEKAAPHKGTVEYRLEYDQEIALRVTNIPTQYGILSKDLEGRISPLKSGDTLILENIQDIDLGGDKNFTLPSGSRFYAKMKDYKKAKSFHRDAYALLEFYQVEINNPQGADTQILIKPGELTTDNTDINNALSNKAEKITKAIGYTMGGALAAPLITYQILGSSLAFTNPYVLSSSSSLGAAIGLAYGLSLKGHEFRLVPGSEIKVKLNNNWFLKEISTARAANLNSNDGTINPEFAIPRQLYDNKIKISKNPDFLLKINEVKRKGSAFNQKCLKINVTYENNTQEELRYVSFRLLDSMNKEYFPESTDSINELSELPNQGRLNLFFCVDFPKAIHYLEVMGLSSYKILSKEKIIVI